MNGFSRICLVMIALCRAAAQLLLFAILDMSANRKARCTYGADCTGRHFFFQHKSGHEGVNKVIRAVLKDLKKEGISE